MIDVTPIREAVENSGLSYYEVAKRAGLYETKGSYQVVASFRVKRYLGIARYPGWDGKFRYTTHVRDQTARRILEAIGKDPVEVGI